MNVACSWKQLIVLTMFACTFVSVILLAVVCGNLAPVYSSLLCGRTADLGQDGTCNPGKVQSRREGSEKEERGAQM